MGHPQPSTPVHVDSKRAFGILNETFQQRKSRSMNMRFFWVRVRVKQGQFRIFWGKETNNLADYFTKHHPPTHHRQMQGTYVLNHIFCRYSSSIVNGLHGLVSTRLC